MKIASGNSKTTVNLKLNKQKNFNQQTLNFKGWNFETVKKIEEQTTSTKLLSDVLNTAINNLGDAIHIISGKDLNHTAKELKDIVNQSFSFGWPARMFVNLIQDERIKYPIFLKKLQLADQKSDLLEILGCNGRIFDKKASFKPLSYYKLEGARNKYKLEINGLDSFKFDTNVNKENAAEFMFFTNTDSFINKFGN
ncbi:MAG TPA: hypothetical protein IAD26_01200 [Candidatus Limenecus avicola]|uniref:Uncharacterized protein n=1 Tax=Candidatus Limenecus avicola TaxID=2840847 RepID=A0A9D1MYY2_9CLOT|nr:hypothetical protein [Candidatus Limenecus avicola]